MRPSPVISAVGTGALAFGLVLAMSPGAYAATAPQTPVADDSAATMQEALARDLDLTQAEATELLEAQEDALDVDAEATEAAGDAYGGSLYDIETQDLTVLVTSADAVAAVEATGAQAEVVEYGTEGLAEVVEALDAADAPEGVTGWYPDVASDTVVLEVLEGTDVDALLADADVDASAVEVVTTDEAPQLYADIIGGLAYYMGGRCSVGFAATNSAGQPGFVTAGHCGTVGTGVTIGNGQGTFERSVFPGNDAAFVRGTSNFTLTNLVSRYNGTYQSVTGTTQAPIGSAICRSGSTTGWRCGTIQARNQTVRYPQGTVNALTRTNVCAEPGDSGGSFISGSQAQGVTSGGSGNCSSGGTTYYQEVLPMVNSWGVRIRTS
ncbi:S1 family peptidase [Nocardiopsis changdeensis]|uniref:S1 family peptidase n=1 Tax=Nocardiopsis changdeensis TaxID=2831969 RepID=A0ABX8BFA2_9ACTN|nr:MULTISPECIES: S1 family peptidase [Nocardiopsis]QUX20925.1 S1 family peptidase [Nocardiopsis changdeensis]QYX36856.1 S1 family peptidase [Nocardiopsis sp. MT53]